ncbi:ADP-ribosyl-[dinitrogen reductase] hydrolase [Actomonas aquatica]|uniref:ADP-ribosyl-[dinitrogen reductase] hydrolase n=1 Tax=Actomonas aquatica TaxID=2866162 RepID=A0ABZ1CCR3_9BACT|nr:ADP-ribosyl-[dinitrogen reductase] hydrolase [Opitutus sp. WL0086]WRQ89221.1 ADP-ribosyl-[dinitrogen reductase] hydrolase [Opitutus sp. WL0086]
MTSPDTPLSSRSLGAYLGLAVGDALGATVEFMTAHEIAGTYGVHRQMVGGGWLRLRPGRVTDDTEMAIALGRALLKGPWDLHHVAEAWVDWMRSKPIDIGNTCRRGLRRYTMDGTLMSPPAEEDGGNGAAMRHLPLAIATLGDDDLWCERAVAQAHVTHNHRYSDAATVALGRMTQALLRGEGMAGARRIADALVAAHRVFRFEPWPGNTSGYVVDTMQTVCDAFFHTSDFESCVVRAVNRGGDADTAGALAGQLAGAHHGVEAIPARWLRKLDREVQREIRAQAIALLELAPQVTAARST